MLARPFAACCSRQRALLNGALHDTRRRRRRLRHAASSASSSRMELPAGDTFFLDDFAARQWLDPSYSGTKLEGGLAEMAAFVARVHDLHASGAAPLVGW